MFCQNGRNLTIKLRSLTTKSKKFTFKLMIFSVEDWCSSSSRRGGASGGSHSRFYAIALTHLFHTKKNADSRGLKVVNYFTYILPLAASRSWSPLQPRPSIASGGRLPSPQLRRAYERSRRAPSTLEKGKRFSVIQNDTRSSIKAQ